MNISQRDISMGIQWGSAFLVMFLLLGYNTLISLLLASTGGIAAGTIASAWSDRRLPDNPPPQFPSDAFRRFGTEEPPHHLQELAQRQARYHHQRQVIHRGRPSPLWEVFLARLGVIQRWDFGSPAKSSDSDEAEDSEDSQDSKADNN
ncbi:MAG: hypothetical protein R6U67_02255 [Sodalinema sp.]|uniref:hypothetical protein n=1 Tax=Sodalinema sp. TaxID=3080550 RepID=UPI00396F515B